METGDDGERFISLDDEHERVGKAMEQGAADDLVDDGKLPGIGAHALDHGFNLRPETPAQTGNLVLVPALRVDQLGAGAWGEDRPDPLRATLLKLGFQSRPGYTLAPVLVERCNAEVKLRPLCGCQGKVVVLQAIPKLRNQRKALWRGQTHKLVVGE